MKKGKHDKNANSKELDEKVALEQEVEQVEALQDQLQSIKEEADDKYKRLFAEFDNYKKRTEREKQDTFAFAKIELIQQLLPIIEAVDSASSMEMDPKLKEGIDLIQNQIATFFEKNNVKVVGEVGEVFDPTIHQAISIKETEDGKSGIITDVYLKGYLLNDKVIRPAMVIVSK